MIGSARTFSISLGVLGIATVPLRSTCIVCVCVCVRVCDIQLGRAHSSNKSASGYWRAGANSCSPELRSLGFGAVRLTRGRLGPARPFVQVGRPPRALANQSGSPSAGRAGLSHSLVGTPCFFMEIAVNLASERLGKPLFNANRLACGPSCWPRRPASKLASNSPKAPHSSCA